MMLFGVELKQRGGVLLDTSDERTKFLYNTAVFFLMFFQQAYRTALWAKIREKTKDIEQSPSLFTRRTVPAGAQSEVKPVSSL